MKLKIGFLGASFDPVHLGHLEIANYSMANLNLHEVWFAPNKKPYYKQQAIATDEQRLKMLQLATEDKNHFKIYTKEIEAPNYTHTIDSLKIIKQEFSNIEIYLLMGSDSLSNLNSWKQGKDILQYANIVVFNRTTHQINKEILQRDYQGERILLQQENIQEISSSDIRNELKNYKDNIGKKTLAYIEAHKIYHKIKR